METQGPRILVVDDDRANRRLIEGILAHTSAQVRQAASGQEALEVARAWPPDLVLLDVMMPGMDGFETAGRLKAMFEGEFLPIVMVTALDDMSAKLRGLEAGADDYLLKPVNRHELLARTRNLLQLRDDRRRLTEQHLLLMALGRFRADTLGRVARDMRRRLATLQTCLEFSARRLPAAAPGDDSGEALADARVAMGALSTLVTDLVESGRSGATPLLPKAERLRLDKLVHDAVLSARRRSQGAARIDTVVHRPLQVLGDATLLARGLDSLLDNALRSTSGNGELTVTLGVGDSLAEVVVATNAPPLPPGVRARIFERMVESPATDAAAPTHGLVGLGLYLARLVAEKHGGTVSLSDPSEPALRFVLRLPLAGEAEAEA
jgi:DNA-binding response OmpR family regulator